MTDILYTLVYIIPMTLLAKATIFQRVAKVDGIENPSLPLTVMLLIAVILTIIINIDNRKRIAVSGSLLALIVGVFLVTNRESRSEWFADNNWIVSALIIPFAVLILGFVMLKSRSIKLSFGVIFAGVLLSSYWTRAIDDSLGLVSAVLLILTILFEEIRYRDRSIENIRVYVIRIVPFLLVGMIVLYLIPSSEKPYDWSVTRMTFDRIKDGIISIIQSFDDGDSANDMESHFGFSEEAKVGGNVGGEPAEEMALITGFDNADYIYLDGKYFEDFDGRQWSEAEVSYPYMMDTLEAFCTFSRIDSDILKDYRKMPEVDITYKGLNTIYAFAPVKSLVSDGMYSDAEFSYFDNEILFTKKQGNSFNYRLKYITFNCDDETLPILLANGQNIDQKLWDSVRKTHNLKGEEYSYEAFLNYKERIYDKSLCPNAVSKDLLSEGVRKFLDSNIEGANSDYEKLCALERSMDDFKYTYNPGPLPVEIDTPYEFLDYFIMDSQRGYCNSFATTLVLLCQAEGIPARLVNGYCVPCYSNKVTSVMNTMAHAYVEAYIEGLGWMVFDPTPGYGGRVMWDAQGRYVASEDRGYRFGGEYYNEDYEEEIMTEENDTSVTIPWYVIVIPLSLVLLVLTFIILIQRALNHRALKNQKAREKALTICQRILFVLHLLGFEKEESETVREFKTRVISSTDCELESFMTVYETVLYSDNVPSNEDIISVMEEYTALTDGLDGINKVYYGVMRFMGKM